MHNLNVDKTKLFTYCNQESINNSPFITKYNLMRKFYLLSLVVLIITFSCEKEEIEPCKAPQNILFIGNSFTYFNKGLAFHLKNFIINDTSLHVNKVEEVTKGGYTLENHWNDTATINKIKLGDWDVIILQEHSLRPVTDKEKMLMYSREFNSLIKSTGNAKLYFFMTWAYEYYPDMIYPLAESYKEDAKKMRAAVIPVGLAWDELIKSNNAINLYNSDGRHPNINGTFFTASIFYKTLFNLDPGFNQYRDTLVSEETASLLKEWANKIKAIQY
jgi:hypothetical protein